MPYLGDYYNVTPNWTAQRQNWFNMLQEIMVNGTPHRKPLTPSSLQAIRKGTPLSARDPVLTTCR